MNWKARFEKTIEGLLEHVKGFILAAFVTIAVLTALVGYRYQRYTQDDPQYCASCHLMKEAFAEWQKGKHRDVVCQQCHQLSLLEKNRLLVAYVVKGTQPLAQSHGREKPWQACRGCHEESAAQGSLTNSKSYGHAKHDIIKRIECKECHKGALHNFKPNENSCLNCHKDKIVHGTGMEAFSCLKCHSFGEKAPSMIPKDRCVRCHTDVAGKGPMSGMLCHQCHKPHGDMHPTAATCVKNCHGTEASVGQHGLHLKQNLDCLYCHKAHSWVVGKEKARVLCSKCHPLKDPKLFIY
jgi:nitrate/TMAO reductase-like tetraheme cytochrome c subunit